MLIFAQAAPVGTENVLAVIFYLIAGFASIVVLYKQLRKKEPAPTLIADQPLHVRAAEEFVSRREHDELKRDVRDLRAENKMLIAEQSRDTNRNFEGVHTRITDLLGAFRELRGELKNVNANRPKAST